MTRIRYALLPSTLMLAGLIQAQSMELQVELMNQIGTDTSRKGDMISARVVSPPHLQGDVVEGRITDSKSGAKLGGQSVFSFTFDMLRHGGVAIPISSQFKSAMNSKGKVNVDEEGRMVRRGTGNVAKAAGGTGFGALVGGLAGGGKGAAIGAVVGAGASIALIQIAADAPNIRFSPGSRVTIEARGRDGSPLPAQGAGQPAPAYAPATAFASPANPAPAPSAPSVYQPQPAAQAQAAPAQAAPAQVAPSLAPAASASSPQPEMTTLKNSFVPGEKTIFYDDFTDMSEGDASAHFKVRGTTPELRAAGAIRQFTVTGKGSMFPNLTSLPKNFTYEAEIKIDVVNRVVIDLCLYSKGKEYFRLSTWAWPKEMELDATMKLPSQELGSKKLPMNWNNPVKLALWVQNGRMRVFLNGDKQFDFNQIDLPEIDQVELSNYFQGLAAGQSVGYRMVRFAESMPDFSQTIGSSGRYVTHGILFDTDSDRMKPESASVIQPIRARHGEQSEPENADRGVHGFGG